jgi:hypothetical protein
VRPSADQAWALINIAEATAKYQQAQKNLQNAEKEWHQYLLNMERNRQKTATAAALQTSHSTNTSTKKDQS